MLIDGHNLIGRMTHIHLDEADDEARLLEQLRRYQARTGKQISVVFDAGVNYQSGETRKSGAITVQYAHSGQSADALLLKRLRRQRNPRGLTVVSSDHGVQNMARQYGAQVISAEDFARDLEALGRPKQQHEEIPKPVQEAQVEEWERIFTRKLAGRRKKR